MIMEWIKFVQRLSLRLPEKEMQIFSRLVFRNKNQHRRDGSFQKLVKVNLRYLFENCVSFEFRTFTCRWKKISRSTTITICVVDFRNLCLPCLIMSKSLEFVNFYTFLSKLLAGML